MKDKLSPSGQKSILKKCADEYNKYVKKPLEVEQILEVAENSIKFQKVSEPKQNVLETQNVKKTVDVAENVEVAEKHVKFQKVPNYKQTFLDQLSSDSDEEFEFLCNKYRAYAKKKSVKQYKEQ